MFMKYTLLSTTCDITIVSSVERERLRESGRKREAEGGREGRGKESVIGVMMMT